MSRSARPQIELNTAQLRSRLKLKHIQSENILKAHHPQAISMLEAAGVRPGGLRAYAAKLLAAGVAASTLMFSPGQPVPALASLPDSSHHEPASPDSQHQELKNQLREILPLGVRPLLPNEEKQLSDFFHQLYGIHTSAELEGNRLNTDYGFIGAEQHLPRYPGDTAADHGFLPEKGLAPGRGAWGYFTDSKSSLTPDLVAREKYYVAVQTLYLSDWETRLPYLRDWYKFRKVLVVNPKNGKAVVADIADSGPAIWTGKQFGGSPEVMDYLESKDGRQRGPVVLFFVDDPGDKVPLGPLEYNLEQPQLLTAKNI
jgi:hypothetical protein